MFTKKTNPHSKFIHIATLIVWANAFLTTLALEAQKKPTTISTSTLSLHGLHASNNNIHPKKIAVFEKTQALSLSQNSYWFLDTRLKLDLDNESNYHEINLGLAKRHPLHDKELVGLYGFHDLTHTENQVYLSQLTLGIEKISSDWYLNINHYIPTHSYTTQWKFIDNTSTAVFNKNKFTRATGDITDYRSIEGV